jgi:mannose-6-phosphate isomerase-like protein (cupin superfamily)
VTEGLSAGGRRAAVVILPGEGRDVRLGGAGLVTIKAERSHSGGTMAAYEFGMPPQTWDEAFYVLEGEVTFLIDGAEHVAPAGSFVFIPRGVPHTFWNAGVVPAWQLTIFTPSGIEDYFDAVSAVLSGGGEESLAAAIALMEQHDMIVPASNRPAYGAVRSPGVQHG